MQNVVKRDKVRVSYFRSSVSFSGFRKKVLQLDYWTDKMAGQPEKELCVLGFRFSKSVASFSVNREELPARCPQQRMRPVSGRLLLL
jgi:hypothetical protein